MKNESNFSLRLKEECKKINKSINQVERDLGYSRNVLHNYGNGRVPSGKRLVELANYFGITPDYLIGSSETAQEKFESLSTKKKEELHIICQNWARSYFQKN